MNHSPPCQPPPPRPHPHLISYTPISSMNVTIMIYLSVEKLQNMFYKKYYAVLCTTVPSLVPVECQSH